MQDVWIQQSQALALLTMSRAWGAGCMWLWAFDIALPAVNHTERFSLHSFFGNYHRAQRLKRHSGVFCQSFDHVLEFISPKAANVSEQAGVLTEASCIVLQFKLTLLVPFGHGVNSWRTNLRTYKATKSKTATQQQQQEQEQEQEEEEQQQLLLLPLLLLLLQRHNYITT